MLWFEMKFKLVVLKMRELKSNHESMKLELQSSHSEQLQQVQHQHQTSLEGEYQSLFHLSTNAM